MDEKSLEVLEFPKIREMVAGLAAFPVSRELALELRPLSDPARIHALLEQSAEARRLLALSPDFSIGEIKDIREPLALAAMEKTLDPATLADIGSTVSEGNRLHGSIEELADDLPLLWSIAEQMVSLPELEREIGRCIDPAGQVLATASPRLVELREELRYARSQMVNRLDSIMKSLSEQNILQDMFITERSGRYVLPVKVEFQSRVRGIIHDVSNTGATVFIEPWAIVEMGNSLRQLALEEEREIHRILTHLSALVGDSHEAIFENLSLAAELDLAIAKARYARSVNGNEAHILSGAESGTGALRLVAARHPLLKGKAVPLSIEIGTDFTGVVITGPNTGGKTVTLKTIGLLVLMTQAGIPIPASEESCIPVFDDVFADIGDEQSIEQTLSTFSWHMGNIVRIIRLATQSSLVLLDELGSSTDPAEGAALGKAILLHFLSGRTATVATTHYGELKAFAHSTPGLENASLVFDPETLKPTYQLVMGVPGGSNALAIAGQLGLDSEIIAAAREMLPGGSTEIQDLIAELTYEKQQIETLRSELEGETQAAIRMRERAEEELRSVADQKHAMVDEARDAITRAAAELQKELRRVSSELKKSRSKESIEQAKTGLQEVRDRLDSEEWQTPSLEGRAAPGAGGIAVGDQVRLIDTTIRGTVVALSEKTGQIEVHAGQTRLKASLQDVEKVDVSEEKIRHRAYSVERPVANRRRSVELDLRGKRADEVEPELDAYLNDVAMAGFDEVRIIHGYGTGTVRKIVRDMLAAYPLVKSFRSGEWDEGGDGVTMVRLQ